MFGHAIRTRLPEATKSTRNQTLQNRDKSKKLNMKRNAEKGMTMRKKPITRGDSVLVKRDGFIGKQQTPYDIQPYCVTDVKGSMITAERESHKITRNSSFFKSLKMRDENIADPTDTSPESQQTCEPTNETLIPSTNPENAAGEKHRYPTRTRKPPAYLKDFVK